MAYLYRHIRLDTNQPFYIGISGKDNNYKRAYIKTKRNELWGRIAFKTNYDVEIVFDNLTEKEVKNKEIEFIKLYGRIDLQTGTLANLTDGGDGVLNENTKSLIRSKISKSSLGKKMSESAKKKMGDNQKLHVLQYDLDGNFIKEWEGTIDAIKFIGGHSTNIMRCCQGKFKQAYGFIWKYKNPEKMGRRIKNQQNKELNDRLTKAGL